MIAIVAADDCQTKLRVRSMMQINAFFHISELIGERITQCIGAEFVGVCSAAETF